MHPRSSKRPRCVKATWVPLREDGGRSELLSRTPGPPSLRLQPIRPTAPKRASPSFLLLRSFSQRGVRVVYRADCYINRSTFDRLSTVVG